MAMALLVICAAAFARLLDGGRAAQVLTASTVAASVITVTLGHRLSTATFDTLAWTAVLLVVGMPCAMIGRGCGSLLVCWLGWA